MATVKQAVKRATDVVASGVALLVLALPFAAIALAIKLDDRGPVFFRQERVGKGGRGFRVWKFRTMVVDAVSNGLGVVVQVGDDRITHVGRVLRDWGIDEFPQVVNALTGEMNLVGPRPTLSYQVAQYDDFERRRLEVRPGITSLAVVSGRNALSWKEGIRLDVRYVDHGSLGLDLRILFQTLWEVLFTREGLCGQDGANDMFVETEPGRGTKDDEGDEA